MSDQPTPPTDESIPLAPEAENDPLTDHLARHARRLAKALQPNRKGSKEDTAARRINIQKAITARRLKDQQLKVIKEKLAAKLPITQEEEEILQKSSRRRGPNRVEAANQLVEMASKMVIKPQTVQALRLVVERTAAKHKYNPIDELIRLTKSDDLNDKEKVAIHKALMPYLIPAVAPAQTEEEATPEDQRPKIVIKNFTLPERDVRPIHESKRDGLTGPEIIVETETHGP
jgi:hypothetical protein